MKSRIEIIDALRGFALLGIILIHCIEHFEIFRPIASDSPLAAPSDDWVSDTVHFLIGGKAYSIFALLFGYSFFIQMNSKAQLGQDFRSTFIWRLAILFVLGMLHSLIYRGDILHIYALVGIPFVLCYAMSTRSLIVVASLLVIQLPLLYLVWQSFVDPDFIYAPYYGDGFFPEGEQIYSTGGLWDVITFNIYKARVVVWAWTYHTGRLVQLMALFMAGLVIARGGYLESLEDNRSKIAFVGYFCLILMLLLNLYLSGVESFDWTGDQKTLVSTTTQSYLNLFYTLAIGSGFILLYIYFGERIKIFSYLAAYGRMSLTNYMSQAILGVLLYYQFGFGLWDDLGATWSLILGVAVFSTQTAISVWWLDNYRYGPMEWLWRALTYRSFRIPNKKVETSLEKVLA